MGPEFKSSVGSEKQNQDYREFWDTFDPASFDINTMLDVPPALHNEIAIRLIESGCGEAVAYNLGKFEGLDHPAIARRLIESGHGYAVAVNLEKFEGLDHPAIAMRLIERGYGDAVAYNLGKFKGLNHPDIAMKLIEGGRGDAVADNLEKFEGLDHPDIAMRLIESGHGAAVAYNLGKFEGLNHPDIAMRLIESGCGRAVAHNLEKFEGLNQGIAMRLIESGYGRAVAVNLYKFSIKDVDILRTGFEFLARDIIHKSWAELSVDKKKLVFGVWVRSQFSDQFHLENHSTDAWRDFLTQEEIFDDTTWAAFLKNIGDIRTEIQSVGTQTPLDTNQVSVGIDFEPAINILQEDAFEKRFQPMTESSEIERVIRCWEGVTHLLCKKYRLIPKGIYDSVHLHFGLRKWQQQEVISHVAEIKRLMSYIDVIYNTKGRIQMMQKIEERLVTIDTDAMQGGYDARLQLRHMSFIAGTESKSFFMSLIEYMRAVIASDNYGAFREDADRIYGLVEEIIQNEIGYGDEDAKLDGGWEKRAVKMGKIKPKEGTLAFIVSIEVRGVVLNEIQEVLNRRVRVLAKTRS